MTGPGSTGHGTTDPATRVLVTGAAGYIGRQVATRLAARHPVVGIDVTVPDGLDAAVDMRRLDIRDPSLPDLVADEAITHVVHLAAVLDGTVDPVLAHDIDVNGTANVVAACVAGRVRHLVLTSSGAAYGYHADNPIPLTEDDPLRGNPTFPYSHHKRQVEELLAAARDEHPDLGQLVLRVGTVLGTDTDNLITDLLTRRVLPTVTGARAGFVFIWDTDLVDIITRGVDESRTGTFNVAGSGSVSMHEVARALGGTAVPIPAAVLRAALALARRAGLSQYGPEQVDFLAHRPVLDNRRLVEEFPHTPTKTSVEALAAFAAARAARS